jgi:DNA-binding transcriptional MerR regulator
VTIAEACGKLGMPADTLRYYEKIGLIPPVRRTEGGIRCYEEVDCNWIEFIKCMRGSGVSVGLLVEYVRLFMEGDATVGQRKDILVSERDRIAAKVSEMQATLDRLNMKIDRYEAACAPVERELLLAQRRLGR